MPAAKQPSGEVTLVFSDIEGSTRLLEELGTEAYREALAEHRRIVREAYRHYSGYEVDYEGDAFFYAFPSAPDAVSAVSEAMAGLADGPIAIRVGMHTGTPSLDPPKYVGMDVHFAARVMSSAHGGQVVLTKATADLVEHDLVELGEHRLKDIQDAVPLYQLGEGSFPPLKTISNTNLPRLASSFLGREREQAEVIAKIEAGARLLTLTGPGGTGKTRLAIEAASSLVSEYKAGVFWVGLASLRDPALVTETIALTLGAKDGLAEHISERELLLLLDNLEQVIEVAPDLSALLSACPNLTLLCTSRELLRVSGEVEYPVPPLAAPEAVSLFCARSGLEPSEEISELCARLDNLPLAVELAAARTKALSPAQILERLKGRLDLLKGGRDADPRQQTLRATIEWSYELLSPEEQALFARLSVFAGGCTLEAAEEVADADLDTLQSLVEKSLLRFSNERYSMLETIREYAGERLEDEHEVRAKHARLYAEILESVARGVRSYEQDALRVMESELANGRAGLAFALDARDAHLSGQYLFALWFHWLVHGHGSEARNAATAWLELDRDDLGPADLATSLFAVSEILRAARTDARDEAVQLAIALKEEIVDVLRAHSEAEISGRPSDGLMAATLTDLSYLMLELGYRVPAERYAEEALALRRRLADPWGISHALLAGANVAEASGNFRAAKQLYVEALQQGEGHPEAAAIEIAIAETELHLGDVEAARTRMLEHLDGVRVLADRVVIAEAARVAALILVALGDARAGAGPSRSPTQPPRSDDVGRIALHPSQG